MSNFDCLRALTKISGVRWSGVMNAGLVCSLLLIPVSAGAQTTPEPVVCVAKSDETGGRMRFVVVESGATAFERAGFQQFACPTLTPEIVQGQADRCARIRAIPPEFMDIIKGLYGMTIDEMCRATDAWAVTARTQ